MHQRKADGEPEPDLLAHDRPVAIGAVAAAFTLKRDEHNTPPLHETEYSGKILRIMTPGTTNPLFLLSVRPNIH